MRALKSESAKQLSRIDWESMTAHMADGSTYKMQVVPKADAAAPQPAQDSKEAAAAQDKPTSMTHMVEEWLREELGGVEAGNIGKLQFAALVRLAERVAAPQPAQDSKEAAPAQDKPELTCDFAHESQLRKAGAYIRELEGRIKEPHPLEGLHINQGSMDAAADAYEAEYLAANHQAEIDKLVQFVINTRESAANLCFDAWRMNPDCSDLHEVGVAIQLLPLPYEYLHKNVAQPAQASKEARGCPSCEGYGYDGSNTCARCKGTGKEAAAQPQSAEQGKEVVAWMFQHEETGRIVFADQWQVENGFEQSNPRLQKIAPLCRCDVAESVPADAQPDLHSTIDAMVWANEFCKLNTAADHGTMLGWFANAIMAGFDEANRRHAAPVQPREDVPAPGYAKNAVKEIQRFMLQERFQTRNWHPIGEEPSQDSRDLAYALDCLTEAVALILNFADRADPNGSKEQ